MSETSDQQDAIVAAIKSIPALAGISIRTAVYAMDCFKLNLSKQSEIFVVYGGGKPTGKATTNTRRSMARETWFIATVSTSFRTPTDAQIQTNGVFDLAEFVRKGLNVTEIPGLLSAGKYLMWGGDDPAEAEDRAANGGSMGFISTFFEAERFM